ncbi:MAG: alpha/beta hydrolase [Chloroflexota bacterium]
MHERETAGITRRQFGLAGAAAGFGAAAGLRRFATAGAETATPGAGDGMAAAADGWDVPAKWLTAPETVSPALRGLVTTPPGEIWLQHLTADQFRQVQAAEAEIAPARAAAVWTKLGVAVETGPVAGVPCYRITPPDVPADRRNRLLVHTHGGAYVINGGANASIEGAWIASATRTPVISIDYRMPPDHPFPAALDDVTAVWGEVMRDRDPAATGLFGTSAGGGLAMALILRAAELGLPAPAALSLSTPWSDLSKTGDSYITMAMIDNAIVTWDGALGDAALLYANGEDLGNPLISPVNGDLGGFPPTILFSGTRDLFLSNTVRVHRKMRQAGIEADLHVFEALPHAGWSPWATPDAAILAPETKDFLSEITAFFDARLQG